MTLTDSSNNFTSDSVVTFVDSICKYLWNCSDLNRIESQMTVKVLCLDYLKLLYSIRVTGDCLMTPNWLEAQMTVIQTNLTRIKSQITNDWNYSDLTRVTCTCQIYSALTRDTNDCKITWFDSSHRWLCNMTLTWLELWVTMPLLD